MAPTALRGWFTIPAHRPFLRDLASGLAARLTEPEALADAVVLVPTRRAARSLAEAFVELQGGRAVLLPQIRAFGDLEEGEPPFETGDLALELPAAIAPRRRRLELARLVHDHQHVLDRPVDAAGALELADVLGAFLDSCHLESVDPTGKLETLVAADFAAHWRVSADFLGLAVTHWRARLAQLGLIDASERQTRLLEALTAQWRRTPPPGVLVAAGSTGSAPATADLLAAIAAAPQGAVVLPGLDEGLADGAWAHVEEEHPQGAMKRLLARAGLDRKAVQPWPVEEPVAEVARGRARRRVINEALRPAEATADWLDQIEALRKEGSTLQDGLEGLSLVSARTEEEAATTAAVLLREALETPGRTAALITPDRALARRVSAKLTRWGVAADSSAGAPLTSFPVGRLLANTAALAIDPADPATLLTVLKHPLVRLGAERGPELTARSAFERRALRGARPRDWTAIRDKLAAKPLDPKPGETDEALTLRQTEADAKAAAALAVAAPLAAAVELFAALFAGGPVPPRAAARAHLEAVEALARDGAGRLGSLWAGPEGELAAALFADLLDGDEQLPRVTAAGWARLVVTLLEGETVRRAGAAHPRLRILGALEARLVRSDLTILAGLEEGVWPRAAPTDPLLSRPMRERLGLPPPERRIGLSAHDFAQAACAPEVVLLRTERRGGAPSVASRWIWRLQTLIKGAALELPGRPEALAWARSLDAPTHFEPVDRPAPKPPVEDRPRRLSVTRVETWVRDPYAVYAREILRLNALDPPDAALEAPARGTAVHAALEQFARAYDDTPPQEREALFEALLNAELVKAGVSEASLPRERTLARNGARWFTDFEARRRAGAEVLVERFGTLDFEVDGRAFRLTAKADRIERRAHGTDILDFKTGMPPTKKDVINGFAPQLTLTAAMLQRGGFEDVGEVEPGELGYVRVTLRRKPGEEHCRAEPGQSADMASEALEGLRRRIARFDDPGTPYTSWTAPQYRGDYGEYDHLARVWEWAVLGPDEEPPIDLT